MNEHAATTAGRWSVVAGAAAIAGLLLVGCGDGSSSGSAPAATTSTPTTRTPTTTTPGTTAVPGTTATTARAPATTAPAPTTQAPERLTADPRLRLDGIGPIRVGMTLEQAEAASNANLQVLGGIPGSDCNYVRPGNGPPGLLFMINGRTIVRVDVGTGPAPGTPPIATVSGIRVGSTEEEVKSTYPGRITVQGHPYVPTGHYLVYNPDPASAAYGLIFETDGQRVTSFRSGFANQVQWIEGCS